jgi:hypothetical protein
LWSAHARDCSSKECATLRGRCLSTCELEGFDPAGEFRVEFRLAGVRVHPDRVAPEARLSEKRHRSGGSDMKTSDLVAPALTSCALEPIERRPSSRSVPHVSDSHELWRIEHRDVTAIRIGGSGPRVDDRTCTAHRSGEHYRNQETHHDAIVALPDFHALPFDLPAVSKESASRALVWERGEPHDGVSALLR